MAICIPCSIANGVTIYELVLTGEWSLSITGLIGYTLRLPPGLEFVDVTSDRDTTTVLIGQREHTDLFVGFMAPHLKNTYRIREKP